MMTAKAKEIGMENTNFANSSGINNTKNVSTVKRHINYVKLPYKKFS